MPDFEAKTGIKVNYVQQPVAAQDQKIPLQLSAKDPSLVPDGKRLTGLFFTPEESEADMDEWQKLFRANFR